MFTTKPMPPCHAIRIAVFHHTPTDKLTLDFIIYNLVVSPQAPMHHDILWFRLMYLILKTWPTFHLELRFSLHLPTKIIFHVDYAYYL